MAIFRSAGAASSSGNRDGCRLLGHDSEPIKAACIEAGLPVIDSRGVAFDAVARLVIRGPMVAVGAPPDPPPHGPFSYVPLAAVAAAYRAAGAEVVNLPETAADDLAREARF